LANRIGWLSSSRDLVFSWVGCIGVLAFLVKDSVVRNQLFVQTGRDCGCDAKKPTNERCTLEGWLGVHQSETVCSEAS
jgi:hypothetical protein